jgi:hypothetical protein
MLSRAQRFCHAPSYISAPPKKKEEKKRSVVATRRVISVRHLKKKRGKKSAAFLPRAELYQCATCLIDSN